MVSFFEAVPSRSFTQDSSVAYLIYSVFFSCAYGVFYYLGESEW